MSRWLGVAPVALFVALIGVFVWRLVLMERGNTPDIIPTVMIDKPVPEFVLSPLSDAKPGLSSADLRGKVTLVNFFASWCVPCRVEHPLLSSLSDKLVLVGVVYKDNPAATLNWLRQMGDPYQALGVDPSGRLGIDFGVYGVPESYLIDRQGRIRYKQVGPFTAEDIRLKLLPLVAELSR